METDKAKMEHRTAIFKMLNWFLERAMLHLQLSSPALLDNCP
jgi:hypothetical protein